MRNLNGWDQCLVRESREGAGDMVQSSRGPQFNAQHPYGSSEPPKTPDPLGSDIFTQTIMQAKQNSAHKIKINKTRKERGRAQRELDMESRWLPTKQEVRPSLPTSQGPTSQDHLILLLYNLQYMRAGAAHSLLTSL